jgi:hypothetical protein
VRNILVLLWIVEISKAYWKSIHFPIACRSLVLDKAPLKRDAAECPPKTASPKNTSSNFVWAGLFLYCCQKRSNMKLLSKFSFTTGFALIFCCLTFQWGTAQIFGGESVEHDPTANRWFSSDDGTSIVQRAANGTNSYFGTGLNADYGMEVMGNTLFAITGTEIRGYDLTTELQVMTLTITGASFLNGLASNGTDKLWATAFSGKKVYEIDVANLAFPAFTEVISNTVTTPNGIVYDGPNNRLVFVSWGSNAPIKAIDLTTYAMTTITSTNLGNLDGIDSDNQGNFYVSSWSPNRISRYDNAFANPPVTISAPGINSPADICYALTTDTLAVPNGTGTVTFIGFTPVSIAEPLDPFSLHFAPNPVSENSWIGFELPSATAAKISVFSPNGQLQKVIMEGQLPAGSHKVLLQGIGLAAGTYLLVFEAEGQRVTRKFLKIE